MGSAMLLKKRHIYLSEYGHCEATEGVRVVQGLGSCVQDAGVHPEIKP